MDLILLLVFNRSHLHELVHNAFDYSFTIVLVRFLPFHPVKHLYRKEPQLHEQIFQDYDSLFIIFHTKLFFRFLSISNTRSCMSAYMWSISSILSTLLMTIFPNRLVSLEITPSR